MIIDATSAADPAGPANPHPAGTAIVTPSYAGDLERCRLLCETVDRFASGVDRHYLLVAGHDVTRFRALEGPRRLVVDERDLLPSWLHAMRDPTSLFRRHIWLSTRTAPLRGWHIQQLRRIAIAEKAAEETLVYCDSDVVFLKPFDCSSFWQNGKLALFRRDDALTMPDHDEHREWSDNAGRVLGLPEGQISTHDYIMTLIAWRRETVRSMIRHIESRHGRHWVEVIASRRRFSECMIYGRYVDEVLAGEGHRHDRHERCRVYWSGPGLSPRDLEEFVNGMTEDQVAIGVQSFTGTDLSRIQALLA